MKTRDEQKVSRVVSVLGPVVKELVVGGMRYSEAFKAAVDAVALKFPGLIDANIGGGQIGTRRMLEVVVRVEEMAKG